MISIFINYVIVFKQYADICNHKIVSNSLGMLQKICPCLIIRKGGGVIYSIEMSMPKLLFNIIKWPRLEIGIDDFQYFFIA